MSDNYLSVSHWGMFPVKHNPKKSYEMESPRWFERGCEDLEQQLQDGYITEKEFYEEMRLLRIELKEYFDEKYNEIVEDY